MQKSHTIESNRLSGQYTEFLIIFSLSLVYQFVMSVSLTPFTLNEGYDSLIFKQMGLSILQGKALYIDLFDHKGPFIFFINALGQFIISGKIGLFILHTINFSFVLFLWYRISLLFMRNRIAALFPVILALLFLQMASNEDNETENWSLIPITYSLYLFAKFYIKHNINAKEYFLLGVSMGVVTFMRVNNMAPNCCVILVLAICFLNNHQRSNFKKMIRYVSYGFLIVTLLVFVVIFILYGRLGIEEMLYGTFTYNFEYLGSSQAIAPDRMRWYIRYGLSSLFFIIVLYIKYRNDLLPHVLLLCYLATFLSMGTKGWQNYFIVFSPLFALSASAFNPGLNKWGRIGLTLLLIAYLGRSFCYRVIFINESDLETFYQKSNEIIDKIKTEGKGEIWNNAEFTGLSVLQKKGLVQSNRVMLGFQLDISERLKKDEIKRFETMKPPYILLSCKIEDENDLYNVRRIKENYILMDQVETGGKLYVYKKIRNW